MPRMMLLQRGGEPVLDIGELDIEGSNMDKPLKPILFFIRRINKI